MAQYVILNDEIPIVFGNDLYKLHGISKLKLCKAITSTILCKFAKEHISAKRFIDCFETNPVKLADSFVCPFYKPFHNIFSITNNLYLSIKSPKLNLSNKPKRTLFTFIKPSK